MLGSYKLTAFAQYVDFEQLKFYKIALSPDSGTLAIATESHLLITDDVYLGYGTLQGASEPDWQQDLGDNQPSEYFSSVETVLEFSKQSGRCTAIEWLGGSNIVCIGFESGDFACFDVNGNGIMEQRCDNTPVVSIKVSTNSLPVNHSMMGRQQRPHEQSQQQQEDSPSLWIMHESAIIAAVPISSLLLGEFDELIRFQLLNTQSGCDFLFLRNVYSPSPHRFLGGLSTKAPSGEEKALYSEPQASHSLLVAGKGASLGLYNVGGAQHFEHFGKFAEYVKSRTVNYVSRAIFSLFGSPRSKGEAAERGPRHALDLTEAPALSATSVLDFDDAKRKVVRLSLDPTGRFVAAADALGRVTLYDTRINTVVRVLKGLRDSRLAWAQREVSSDTGTSVQLALGTYAPRLGLVVFHAVPSGVQLSSVPVGLHAQVVTISDREGTRSAKCCAWVQLEGQTALELRLLNPWQTGPEGPRGGGLAEELALEAREDGGQSADNIGLGPPDNVRTAFLSSLHCHITLRSLIDGVSDPVKALELLKAVQEAEMEPDARQCLSDEVHESVNTMLVRVTDGLDLAKDGSGHASKTARVLQREAMARQTLFPAFMHLRRAAAASLSHHHMQRENAGTRIVPVCVSLLDSSSPLSRHVAACTENRTDSSSLAQVKAEAIFYCRRTLRSAAASLLASFQSPTRQNGHSGVSSERSGPALRRGHTPMAALPTTTPFPSTASFSPPSSQVSPTPLRVAALTSPRDRVTGKGKNEGSTPGGQTNNASALSHTMLTPSPSHSRRGSFSSTASPRGGSFDLFFGNSSPASSSPLPQWPIQPIREEEEANAAMALPFSVFRALFTRDARSRVDAAGRESGVSLAPLLALSAPISMSLPFSLKVDSSAALYAKADTWELDEAVWRGFTSLLLGPLLSTAAPSEGTDLDSLFVAYRNLGLDSVVGTSLLLRELSTALAGERGGCFTPAVERMLFILTPDSTIGDVYTKRFPALLKPWLKGVVMQLHSVYSNLQRDLDMRRGTEGLADSLAEESLELEEEDAEMDETHSATADPPHQRTGNGETEAPTPDAEWALHAVTAAREAGRAQKRRAKRRILEFLSQYRNNTHATTGDSELMSFDSLLEKVLERGFLSNLICCERSAAAMGACSVLLEVLRDLGSGTANSHEASSGALEVELPIDIPVGRSYQRVMQIFRQLRTAMVLSERSGTSVSVLSLGDSPRSVYALLAQDTLRFALTGQAAMAHEKRCRETVEKRLRGSHPGPGDMEQEGLLLAFGTSADRRWRELAALVETEGGEAVEKAEVLVRSLSQGLSIPSPRTVSDASVSSTSSMQPQSFPLPLVQQPIAAEQGTNGSEANVSKGVTKKRRPLLLQFPFHNQPIALGMHRALALSAKWLTWAYPSLSPAAQPSDEALLLERPCISPHYLILAASQLEALPVVPKTACALSILLANRDKKSVRPSVAIVPLLLRVAAQEEVCGSLEMPSQGSPVEDEATRELLGLLAQSSSQPAAVHEMVQGTLELLLAARGNISASIDIAELQSVLQDPSSLYLSPSASVCSDLSGGGLGGPWPPLHDRTLSSILADLLAAQSTSSSAALRTCFSTFMSELLLVLFLRHACRLRGAGPSELFPASQVERMYALSIGDSGVTDMVSFGPMQMMERLMNGYVHPGSQSEAFGGLDESRREFLLQCLGRVPADHEVSEHLVYRLGVLWGHPEEELLLIHLPILLDRALDQRACEVLGRLQFSDSALSAVIEGLRKRAGGALIRLRDQLMPTYKQVTVLADEDCLRWALRAAGPEGEPSLSTSPFGVEGSLPRQRDFFHSLLQCDVTSSNVLAVLVSEKLSLKSATQQKSETWRRMSGKSNALLILFRALSKIKR